MVPRVQQFTSVACPEPRFYLSCKVEAVSCQNLRDLLKSQSRVGHLVLRYSAAIVETSCTGLSWYLDGSGNSDEHMAKVHDLLRGRQWAA